jgi:hypothetical protein
MLMFLFLLLMFIVKVVYFLNFGTDLLFDNAGFLLNCPAGFPVAFHFESVEQMVEIFTTYDNALLLLFGMRRRCKKPFYSLVSCQPFPQ